MLAIEVALRRICSSTSKWLESLAFHLPIAFISEEDRRATSRIPEPLHSNIPSLKVYYVNNSIGRRQSDPTFANENALGVRVARRSMCG